MIHEIVRLAPALLIGVALGALFFGSLWWTVKKGIASKRSWWWFAGGMLLRMIITLTGFYLVVRGQHWEGLLVCLAGFVIARGIVMRLTRAHHPVREVSCAP
jgi:F1F0 ATPase subunit 2